MAAEVASCSRENVRLLLATKRELASLAEVQALVAAAGNATVPPNLLQGLFARVKYKGEYLLLHISHLVPAEGSGKPALAVQVPDSEASDPSAAPKLLAVPLGAASGTNPLLHAHWESAGQQELARLQAAMQQQGQSLPLAQAAAAAWRKQAALRWQAQHGQQPAHEQQAHLPALLRELADAGGMAALQKQLTVEEGQRQQLAGGEQGRLAGSPVIKGGSQPEAAEPTTAAAVQAALPTPLLREHVRQPEARLPQQRQRQQQQRQHAQHPPSACTAPMEAGRAAAPLQLPGGPKPRFAPVLMRYGGPSSQGRSQWEMTTNEVFVAGLRPDLSQHEARAGLERMAARVGATVVDCNLAPGTFAAAEPLLISGWRMLGRRQRSSSACRARTRASLAAHASGARRSCAPCSCT